MKAQEYVQSLLTNYAAIKKDMEQKINNNLVDVFKEFFEKHPEVKFVTWTQFTPYFNDGEPCVFSMYGPEFCLDDRINIQDFIDSDQDFDVYLDNLTDELSVEGQEFEYYYPSSYKLENDLDAFGQFLGSMEGIFYNVFGDNQRVVITPEKIEIMEYNEHH